MTTVGSSATGGGGGRISAFLHWWLGELRMLAPRREPAWTRARRALRIESGPEGDVALLVRRGRRRDRVLRRIILADYAAREFETDGEFSGSGLDLPGSGPALRLMRDQVLSRRVAPPRAAEAQLGAVLRHAMASQMPFGPEEAYFDYRVLGRNGDRLEVDLVCVSRAKLDRWRSALAAAGLSPEAVTVEEPDQATRRSRARRAVPIDLLRDLKDRRWSAGAPRRWALTLLVLVLLGAAVWGPMAARQEQNARLASEVAALQREAREAITLEEEIADLARRDAALRQLLDGGVSRLSLLAAATRALPDGAWLRSFEVKDQSIRFDGVAAEAAPLIATVEASPAFRNASFLSPVLAAPEGGERFEIGADLETKASAGRGEKP